jgi:TolA-binding protein
MPRTPALLSLPSALFIGPVLILTFAFLLATHELNAGEVLTIDADQQLRLAADHFRNGDYHSAITEYKRFINFFPQHPEVITAHFKIAMSHFRSQSYPIAITLFEAFIDRFAANSLTTQAYFKISQSYLALGDSANALLTLHNLILTSHDPDVRDRAHYQMGWIYIDSAAWEQARKAFAKIRPVNQVVYRLPEVLSEIEHIQNLPPKSPQTAGILAILPGAGHVYTERYQDALVSFLVNSALFAAAYASFDSGNDIVGGLFTLVGIGFYSGNIYSAVSSAHKFNRRQTEQSIRNLQKRKFHFSAHTNGRGFEFALNYRF